MIADRLEACHSPQSSYAAPPPDQEPVVGLYTSAKVAVLLKMTPRTVQHWIRISRQSARHYGRFYRVRVEGLIQFGRDTFPEA
jgi:hypothetical protein